MTKVMRRPLVVLVLAVIGQPVQAQLTMGAGAGGGTGSRGGDASGMHLGGFLEVRVPMLTGLRGDVMVLDTPSGTGKLSLALNAVLAVPIPVITPYVLGGWGRYGVGNNSSSRGGWNYGAGVRTSLGVGLYAEYRRHQRIARDLFTVGVLF